MSKDRTKTATDAARNPIDAFKENGGQSFSIPIGELVAPGTPNSTKQPAPETRPERGPALPPPAKAR